MSNNYTTVSNLLPVASIYTAATILICMVAITFIGNILLVTTICKEKRLRRPLYILLGNFLVADIAFVSISVPLNIATFLADGPPFGNVVCYVQVFVSYGTISTSACVLTAIAIYRLVQICFNNIYVRITSWKWLLGAAVISWGTPITLCAIFGGPPVYEPLKYACAFTDITLTYVLISCLYMPMIVTVFACYVKIYIFTKKARQRVEGLQTHPGGEQKAPASLKRKDEVVFKMMLLIFVEFLFFYIGPGILNATLNAYPESIRYHMSLVAFMLFRIRSAANCVTYLITNGELRTGIRKLSLCFTNFTLGSGSANELQS